jgi:hypothetical protein
VRAVHRQRVVEYAAEAEAPARRARDVVGARCDGGGASALQAGQRPAKWIKYAQ